MDNLPILLFPSPESASKSLRHPFGGNLSRPTAQRQGQRLNPIFQQLQESFNARNVELQQIPTGIDPEQVLVIETVGNVEDFANAVKRISGLEWMGEYALDGIPPDEDFQDRTNPEKELSGRLYMIMSNQAALSQMLSLWRRYTQDADKINFRSGEYHGLAKFKDVFLHLRNIRRWGIEDRLAEREMFNIWRENIDIDPHRFVRFEAELWYRKDEEKRRESVSIVADLIRRLGGNVISQCVLTSIAYHSILGEIPANEAQQILLQPEVDLIKCENIMFLRPTGQMATGKESVEGDLSDFTISSSDLPVGDPLVAVFDGLPLENHNLLSGRLIIEDPDDWAEEYPAIDRQHGTAMTSLIVHGDLNDGYAPLKRPIYARPIMRPNPASFHTPRIESVPEEILIVDYIHRAVKRIFEGEGDAEASAPTVKIINLSIGDPSRHFSQLISPLARLLDWLSEKYNILFIISSGNHAEPIDTGMSSRDFESLGSRSLEALVVRKIYEDARNRRLLSPAESINGLTVGAIHKDSSQNCSIGYLVNVFESILPSPISAFGSGYRRAIKPDIVFDGGRVLYNQSYGPGSTTLQISNRRVAPGNQVAAPSTEAGALNKSQFRCGSSNSAALISRAASICYDYLVSIFSEQAPDINYNDFAVPILKSMLVHGCSWNELGSKLNEILNDDNNGRQVKNWISRWIGYGIPDIGKVLGCNEQRATIFGFGNLHDGEAHIYNLPLPPSLSARREWRKLTVTLAWLSPVASTTQRYRAAHLWFDFEDGIKSREKLKGKLRVIGTDNDSDATRRGTIQHEVFEGESAVAISDGDILKIKVNCRKDAKKIYQPIAYGLIVSIEVAEGVDLPIYNDIRVRVAPTIEIRT